MEARRRALGDITDRHRNLTRNVVKVDRPITRISEVEIIKNKLAHGEAKKENLVIQRCGKRGLETEENELYTPRTKAASMNDEEPPQKETENSDCDSSDDSYMSIETADSGSDTEKSSLHEYEEIEMEEAESPLINIDKSDARNPLAVVEYVKDIYTFYRKSEIMSCVPADYMSYQVDINHKMRAVLVDWLIEVHHKFELLQETLFLAINLIDRYLSQKGVTRKFLQLVGITGMLIASKYEEIFPPQVSEFIAVSAGAYTRADVLNMEKSILNNLQFNLSLPTPFMFMRRFLKAAESDNKLEMVSYYLLELCMIEYQMLQFPPSLVSAAAIYIGRSKLRRTPLWNKSLKYYCTYTEDQLQECVKLIEQIHQNASEGKLTAVYRKYSISKYSCTTILMKETA